MTLEQHIAEFLRDAQYRLAEMSYELSSKSNRKIKNYDEKLLLLKRLTIFIHLLYVEDYPIYDTSFNFLNWSKNQIIKEIEFFRAKLNINVVAFAEFVNYKTIVQLQNQILNITNEAIAANDINAGSIGQNAIYVDEKTIGPQSFDTIAGYDGTSISQYFNQ